MQRSIIDDVSSCWCSLLSAIILSNRDLNCPLILCNLLHILHEPCSMHLLVFHCETLITHVCQSLCMCVCVSGAIACASNEPSSFLHVHVIHRDYLYTGNSGDHNFSLGIGGELGTYSYVQNCPEEIRESRNNGRWRIGLAARRAVASPARSMHALRPRLAFAREEMRGRGGFCTHFETLDGLAGYLRAIVEIDASEGRNLA
jgi:hypothetical protein